MSIRRRLQLPLRGWVAAALVMASGLAACTDPDTIQQVRGENQPLDDGGASPDPLATPDATPGSTPDAMTGAACGNGLLDPGEACDGTPGCSASCQLPVVSRGCGDTVVTPPEECDDGNLANDDACSSQCLLIACHNGRVDPGETCDREDGTCVDCQTVPPPAPAVCGNRVLEGLEECDEGGLVMNGCGPLCLRTGCGNVRLDPGEECDPPDGFSCDSCRRVECGNGKLEGLEACDDGNRLPGDGCDPSCQLECGNGRLDPNEDCDQPAVGSCDGSCRALRVECGDGTVQQGEECDDGNLAFGDGCSPSCQLEKCGNGTVEAPAEACEPPGTSVCTSTCKEPRCGDGQVTRPQEECEDGNLDNGDGCSATCRIEVCGNGILEAPEQCDPPNGTSCDARCRAVGSATAELALPLGAAQFRLENRGFDGSLAGWSLFQPESSTAQLSPLDSQGILSSGSVQLSSGGLSSLAVGPGISQCVQTRAGAAYQLSVGARVPAGEPGPVGIQLRARFYEGPSCDGRLIEAVSRGDRVKSGSWVRASLPPPSPVAGHDSSFAAPAGALSLGVSLELMPEPGDAPSRILFDAVELTRATAARCGDGIPEGNEHCEPSVSQPCGEDCRLPVRCGDGIAAPGECGSPPTATSCPADCARVPAVCGDGTLTAPEECDPPAAGACSATCTVLHTNCGNGKREGAEQCDPPNGWSCDAQCRTIRCGNGTIEAPEECEPPGEGACSEGCRLKKNLPSVCGDRLLQGAEDCDPPDARTWCSADCRRRNPSDACGDGHIDFDLDEQCDPPGYASHCGGDCRLPVCGDGRVSGGEHCEPPGTGAAIDACGVDCRYPPSKGAACQECLRTSCTGSGPSENLFAACFELEGLATVGSGQGRPLRELCAEAVQCMVQTECASETAGPGTRPNALSCYCGSSVITDPNNLVASAEALRECRDGTAPARGACRAEFERAAQAVLDPVTGRGAPASIFAAATRSTSGRRALSTALRLMTECGHVAEKCGDECNLQPACGDGVIGHGETCDPRHPERNANCDPTSCTLRLCGNGVVDPGETCDTADPYTNANGRCDPSCQLMVKCGDGRRSAGIEACDGSVPGESWADCCKPTALGAPADPSHLEACDEDTNGKIDDAEGCKIPEVCGNGRREGLEHCDPPNDTTCDEQCRLIEPPGACTECKKANCGHPRPNDEGVMVSTEQFERCFENDLPTYSAGCIEVFSCMVETECVTDDGIAACLCGDVPFSACQINGVPANGACLDVMSKNSRCAGDQTCLWTAILNPRDPLGGAAQLMQCHQDLCWEECFASAE